MQYSIGDLTCWGGNSLCFLIKKVSNKVEKDLPKGLEDDRVELMIPEAILATRNNTKGGGDQNTSIGTLEGARC